MRYILIIVSTMFFNHTSYGNDSIIIKAQVVCKMNNEFFKCGNNDFKKLIDPTDAVDQEVTINLEILISKNIIEFITHKNKISYNISNKINDTITFESPIRNIYKAISTCNTGTYPYVIVIDIFRNELSMYYDRSSIKRNNYLVFKGKMKCFYF